MNNKLRVFIVVLITSVLMYIPYVNNFVKIFNTLFHESGHAITTVLTHGSVEKISLFSNVEGVTLTRTSSWFDSLLTSMSGYIFASAVALFFAFLWYKNKNKTILSIILGFSLFNLVFWVRNLYGMSWILISSALLALVLWKVKQKSFLSSLSLVLTLILTTEAVLSAFDIMYLGFQSPLDAGDATNLSHSTFLPASLWGIFFFLQSLVFAFFSVRFILKAKSHV